MDDNIKKLGECLAYTLNIHPKEINILPIGDSTIPYEERQLRIIIGAFTLQFPYSYYIELGTKESCLTIIGAYSEYYVNKFLQIGDPNETLIREQ